ncbi:hypothetical protein L1887_39817 [Cichorium endivia]|nr:hypothetical protein L1887_39817 [Cichorium endivia]
MRSSSSPALYVTYASRTIPCRVASCDGSTFYTFLAPPRFYPQQNPYSLSLSLSHRRRSVWRYILSILY